MVPSTKTSNTCESLSILLYPLTYGGFNSLVQQKPVGCIKKLMLGNVKNALNLIDAFSTHEYEALTERIVTFGYKLYSIARPLAGSAVHIEAAICNDHLPCPRERCWREGKVGRRWSKTPRTGGRGPTVCSIFYLERFVFMSWLRGAYAFFFLT